MNLQLPKPTFSSTANLKDLLITTDQAGIDPQDWEWLDSALVALRSRMGEKPLNFYLTSHFNLEEEEEFFLPIFTRDRRISIDKSLVETSMKCKGSSFKGTHRRYTHLWN